MHEDTGFFLPKKKQTHQKGKHQSSFDCRITPWLSGTPIGTTTGLLVEEKDGMNKAGGRANTLFCYLGKGNALDRQMPAK